MISTDLAKYLRNYFERSGEVAGAASDFFRHSFNGNGRADGNLAEEFSRTAHHADQSEGST